MASSYDVIWLSSDGKFYDGVLDLVLLANADTYSDSARITPGYMTDGAESILANAVAFSGKLNHLTVGGNYSEDNIAISLTCTDDSAPSGPVNETDSKKEYLVSDVSAVYFSQDGVLHLSSKTGARTADDSHKARGLGQKFSDDNIKISASGAFSRSADLAIDETTGEMTGVSAKQWKAAPSVTVAAIRADKSLVFASSLSGKIQVKNSVVAQSYDGGEVVEYERISGGTTLKDEPKKQLKLYRDDTVSTAFKTYGVFAPEITLQGNQQASVTATLEKSQLISQAEFQVESNLFDTAGIFASQTLTAKNIWCGSVAVKSENPTAFVADGFNPVHTAFESPSGGTQWHEIVSWISDDSGMEGYIVPEDRQTKYENAVVKGNQLSFRAVAAKKLTLGAIGQNKDTAFSKSGFDPKAKFELSVADIEFTANAKERRTYKSSNKGLELDKILRATAEVSGNTVTIAALQGDTISIDSVAEQENAKFSITTGDILFTAKATGGTSTAIVSGNTATVAAIFGKKISLGDFNGSIHVETGKIIAQADAEKTQYSGNVIAVAGIYADTLTVERRLGGVIEVSSEKRTGNQTSLDAIRAKTLTVHGRIETTLIGGGIHADTLSADAISCMISDVAEGIVSASKLTGNYTYDALDITGSIRATDFAVIGGTDTGTNLRVSGVVASDAYAIVTENCILSPQNDIVEIAAGGTVSGAVDLRAGANYMILDSAASFKGITAASGGNVKFAFILNGDKQTISSNACYTVDGDGDYLFSSVASIGVNLDYALNNTQYTLVDFGGDDAWKSRSITFLWRGEEQKLNVSEGVMEKAFADGTRASVSVVNGKLSVKLIKSATAKALAKLDTAKITETFSAAKQNYTIDWTTAATASAWKNAMSGLQYYELEYSINGGNSIVLRLDTKQTKAVINGIGATDKVKWRIRSTAIGEESSTYYREMTQWSDWEDSSKGSSDSRKIDVSTLAAQVSGAYQAEVPITASTAIFSWNAAKVTNTTIDHYVVQYYESSKAMTAAEAQKALDSKPTATKSVRDTSLALSSLTNRSYIYWRVQAVDIYGTKSAFVYGNEFRVDPSDTTPPKFYNDKVSVTYKAAKGDDLSKITLYVAWDKATDDKSGVKKYRVTVTQGDKTYTKDVDHSDSKSSYSCTFSNLAAGEYTCSVTAYDYCLQKSTISTTGIYGSVPISGEFTSITAKPKIEAEILYTYEKKWKSELIYDEKTGTLVPGGTVRVASGYKNASATFTWKDNFTSDYEISYALEFGDKKDFSGKTAIYYVRDEEVTSNGSSHTVTLDNDSTHPIGILAALSGGTNKNLYWRIVAGNLDSQGNFAASANGQSKVNSFQLVAKDDEGQTVPISFLQSPAKPTVTLSQQKSDNCYNGKIDLTWKTAQNGLGISSYVVKLTNKTKSSLSRSWTLDYNDPLVVAGNTIKQTIDLKTLYLGAACDGKYSLTVTAKDSNGGSTASAAKEFTVDLTRPKTVTVTAKSYASDVRISWTASSDASGISKYYVYYRAKGASSWTKQSVSASSLLYSTPKLSNGTYETKVYAVDKSGNYSLASSVKTVTVNNSYDLCDTYSKAKWTCYTGNSFTVHDIANSTTQASVGASDKADYFYFTNSISFGLTFKVSALAAVSSSDKRGIKISLYKYDGTGKEKAIKTVSLAKAATAFSDLSLAKGTYFVKVTSSTSTSINTYTLKVTKKQYSNSTLNNTKDNSWKTLDTKTFKSLSVKNTKLTDWVGFGDTVDYRALDIAIAGNYQLTLKATSNPVTLTVYQKKSDGSLTTLKTITCKAGKSNSLEILLQSNSAAQYYIAVKNPNASQAKNTDYQVVLKGVKIFGKDGKPFGNNADDTWKKVKSSSTYTVKKGSSFKDWVGFGDTVDYRKLNMKYAGSYTFTLKNATAPVTLTIYRQKGSGSLEKIKSVSVSSGTARISNLLLPTTASSGYDYYLSVTATKASTAKNTDYQLSITGSEYKKGITADDTYAKAKKGGYILAYKGNVGDEWVGYGDTIDYRLLQQSYDGKYTFTLKNIVNPVTVTLWQLVDGKLKKITSKTISKGSGSLKNQLLKKSGEYYISVSADGASSGRNSDYTLTMTGTQFKLARTQDNWSDLKTQGSSSKKFGSFGTLDASQRGKLLARTDNVSKEQGNTANWVGFGDTVDYVQFKISAAGKLSFTLKAEDTHGKTTISVCKLQKSGSAYSLKTLTSVSVSAGSSDKSVSTTALQLTKGTYYLAVKSEDAATGASTNYSVALKSSSKFYKVSDNTDDTWQKAAENQDGREISKGEMNGISDWVGFGNAKDFWKFNLHQNGKLELDFDDGLSKGGSTWTCYDKGRISFKLFDGNGNEIGLTLDSKAQKIYSKSNLSSLGNYYLGVYCNDTAKYDSNDYQMQLCIKSK